MKSALRALSAALCVAFPLAFPSASHTADDALEQRGAYLAKIGDCVACHLALREGAAKDGHNLYPAMPYPSFAKVNNDDMHVLYAYFRNGVAPVKQANCDSDIKWPLNMRWPLKLRNVVFLEGRLSGQAGQGCCLGSRRVPDPGARPLRLVSHAARHRAPGEGA